LTAFLREGISYLFLAALNALKKNNPPDIDQQALERIRVSFITKYKLSF
jgi:hypothetical protein